MSIKYFTPPSTNSVRQNHAQHLQNSLIAKQAPIFHQALQHQITYSYLRAMQSTLSPRRA